MPNHVQNRITADDAETMARIRARLCDADGRPDFNRLIRMPEHQPGVFYIGDVSRDDEDSHPRGNCLDWARNAWGTKWNAYGCPDKRDTDTTLRFETAWSFPMPVAAALAAAEPGLSWTWDYASEDYGHHFGRLRCDRGALTFLPDPDDPAAWARRLHFDD